MFKSLMISLSAAAMVAGATAAQAETVYYTLPDMAGYQPVSLGQMIAYRMDAPQLSQFRDAVKNARLTDNFDPEKGYTVFAVANNVNVGGKSVEYFIVNDRIALRNMCKQVKNDNTCVSHDWVRTINGETLHISKLGSDFYVNDMLVNDVERNPEGLIYTIGGVASPASL